MYNRLPTTSFMYTHICVCLVTKLCPTFCYSMDYSTPGSPVHGIFQTSILDWVAISSSRESSWARDWTQVSYVSSIGRQVFHHYITWEAMYTCIHVCKSLDNKETWMWMLLVNINGDEKNSNLLFSFCTNEQMLFFFHFYFFNLNLFILIRG